ncbi:MAG TPA: DUF4350 domain-containing protein, partial [Patescibacteria group bacterium]|nr:DUF4350 domain-containing protein [Patescibacteria group bacterium]
FNRANEHLAPAPGAVARSMFGWSAALLGGMCLLLPAAVKTPRAAGSGAGRIRGRIRTIAAIFLAAVTTGMMLQAGRPSGPRRPGPVVLLKSAAFDMNVPSPGRFGSAQAGMMGMLPRYLALDGHRVLVHEGEVTDEALSQAAVVIAALPASPWKPTELRALEIYVRQGGSLIVLGDHTDLLGTMGPLNALTSGWGITFQFDSAFPAAREWAGCLDAARRSWRINTGIGTGASLRIGAGVRPMIIGRFGLADAGNRANTGRGANLGDYAYQPGEQLGDLVLAAGRNLGRGRVVVLGDTSSFQNLVLPFSYPFIASLFDDLARPVAGFREAWSAGSGIAAAGLGVMALAGCVPAAAGLAMAVATSALWAELIAGPSALDRIQGDARVALIDAGHLNSYAREFWRDDSAGGLIVNLERAGYLPLMVDDPFDGHRLGHAALPVVVGPRRPLSNSETRRLVAHIEHGGDLLVAAGADEASSVAPLLWSFGLSIGGPPLGPVPVLADMDRAAYEAGRRRPQFRRAWSVRHAEQGAPVAVRSLYSAFGFDVVVEAHREGGGRLLLIADSDFLTDRVLESENDAWEGNVNLLSGMLRREGGG